jgi:hypothetical protein
MTECAAIGSLRWTGASIVTLLEGAAGGRALVNPKIEIFSPEISRFGGKPRLREGR